MVRQARQLAALPRFLIVLTLSQPGETDYAHPLALPHPKKFCDYAPGKTSPLLKNFKKIQLNGCI